MAPPLIDHTADRRPLAPPPDGAPGKTVPNPKVVDQCKTEARKRGGPRGVRAMNEKLCVNLTTHNTKTSIWIETVQKRYYYTAQYKSKPGKTPTLPFLRVPYSKKLHPLIQGGMVAFPLGHERHKTVAMFDVDSSTNKSFLVTMRANPAADKPQHYLVVFPEIYDDKFPTLAAQRAEMAARGFLLPMSGNRGAGQATLDRCNLRPPRLTEDQELLPAMGCDGAIPPFYTMTVWPKGDYKNLARLPKAPSKPQPLFVNKKQPTPKPAPVVVKPAPQPRPKPRPASVVVEKPKPRPRSKPKPIVGRAPTPLQIRDGRYITEKAPPNKIAEDILRTALHRKVRGRPAVIVFALDISGSMMGPHKRRAVKEAIVATVEGLEAANTKAVRIGITFFSDEDCIFTIVPQDVTKDTLGRLFATMDQFRPETFVPKGSRYVSLCTDIEAVGIGTLTALELMKPFRKAKAYGHIVVLTDHDGMTDDSMKLVTFPTALKRVRRAKVDITLKELTTLGYVGNAPRIVIPPSRGATYTVVKGIARQPETSPNVLHRQLRAAEKTDPKDWETIIPLAVALGKHTKTAKHTEHIVDLLKNIILQSSPTDYYCRSKCFGAAAADLAVRALGSMGKPAIAIMRQIVHVSNEASIKQLVIGRLGDMGADGRAMLNTLKGELSDARLRAVIEATLSKK